MKLPLLLICTVTTLANSGLCGDNLVTNGDFETGTAEAFWGTPGWRNLSKPDNQGTNARLSEQPVVSGAYSATVNDRYDVEAGEYRGVAHGQKTGYQIQDGDSFRLTYSWMPYDKYWQRSADTVRFVLFATEDDKISGPVVWSAELTSDFFSQSLGTAKLVDQGTDPVNAEAVGRTLFIVFYALDTINKGKDSTPHFARVDDISIEAIPKSP